MASNDQWPPVATASSGKGAAKANGNKRNMKESQQKILSAVTEMFGTALEPDVILSVVQNCHWELQPSIEGLITLTETVDDPLIWNDLNPKNDNVFSVTSDEGQRGSKYENIEKDFTKYQSVLQSQDNLGNKQNNEPCWDTTSLPKLERQKRGGAKNRMNVFCGNIAKLKSSGENNNASFNITPRDNDVLTSQKVAEKSNASLLSGDDCFFDDIKKRGSIPKSSMQQCGLSNRQNISEAPKRFFSYDNFPDLPHRSTKNEEKLPANLSKKCTNLTIQEQQRDLQKNLTDSCSSLEKSEFMKNQKFASLDKTNMRKTESESLCGLKVQYRLSGMESSSDDDADVVVEEESSDYEMNIPSSIPVNVCQFLSSSTETPPRRTQPEVEMISTPSPPRTPERNAHDATLNRIKTSIQKGHKIMILLRGLPGSGKTTLAKKIIATTIGGNSNAYVFSADDFFVTLGRGIYQFDPSRLQDAHDTSQRRVQRAAMEGRSPIIVDNTNIEAGHMRSYVATGVKYGYIIETLETNTSWALNVNELAKKNIHNVSKSKIRDRYEKYERDISGKLLVDMFGLKYSTGNKPPQRRLIPPFVDPVTVEKADKRMADIKSNWGNHEKNNYVLTSHDIESMQNIDESHNATGLGECASVVDDSKNFDAANNPENTRAYGDSMFHDYLQELQNSDDESFDMVECSESDHPSDIGKSSDSKENTESLRGFGNSKDAPVESLEEYIARITDPSPSGSHQSLGAIGSERKGSFSVASSVGNLDAEKAEIDHENNDNVLSQCWDFTLLLNGTKIHSTAANISREANESEKEISKNSVSFMEDRGKEISGDDKDTNVARNSEDFEEELNELVLSEDIFVNSLDFKKSIVNDDACPIDDSDGLREKPKEFFLDEEISVKMDDCANESNIVKYGSPEITNESIASNSEGLKSPLCKEVYENFDEFVISTLENVSQMKSILPEKERDTEKDDLLLSDEIVDIKVVKGEGVNIEQNSSMNFQSLNIENDAEISIEISETEVKLDEEANVGEEQSTAKVTFGSIFNLIKTSILGGNDELSMVMEYKEEKSRESERNFIDDEKVDNSDEKNEFLNSKADVDLKACGLSRKLDNAEPMECSAEIDSDFKDKEESADSGETKYPELSTNPFREEMIKSRVKQHNYDETKCTDGSCEETSPERKVISGKETDNINSISWKESPFPIDGAKIPVVTSLEDNKLVLKIDAATNTTYYDFNVAYVGGTAEPGYRELPAFNRSINQGSSVAKVERPPLKLMLDKSSMTSEANILANEPNFDVEDGKSAVNRIPELIELFPHIPIEYLTEIYEQLCKWDFDWAVEVLLDGVTNDVTIKDSELKKFVSKNDDTNAENSNSGKMSGENLEHKNMMTKQYPGLDMKDGKWKRSHSSSPRHRRTRSKDFRSFSLEDQKWSSGTEFWTIGDEAAGAKNDEDEVVELLYAKESRSTTTLSESWDESPNNFPSELASGSKKDVAETEADNEDTIELNFGREVINQLEQAFGHPGFAFPEEFMPVIRLKKSMAEELHGLWIQSMYQQLNARHAQLDEMIAKDAEFARALDREETVESTKEPAVPNLDEIMDMEMALASYKNELKEIIARETPNDMASRLTRQMLYESLPDIDQQTLSEILKAHDGNFKETCEIIELSTGRTISKTDTLKKQQSLFDRVKEESKNRSIRQNSDSVTPVIVVRSDNACDNGKSEKMSYKTALEKCENARMEAQKQFSLRVENFNKATEAYRKGYPEVAAYYSQMAKLHSENIQTANDEAMDAFITAQIYGADGEDTLDLHNLFVPEALQALDIFLDHQLKKLCKSNKKSSSLYIITGRGARSNNGLSKIKPAVSKKLISRNIRFTEANPGCLKVTLSKRNGLLD